MVQANSASLALGQTGRRCLALLNANPVMERLTVENAKLNSDNEAFAQARDWWLEQSRRWEAQNRHQAETIQSLIEAMASEHACSEALKTQLDEVQVRIAEAERRLRWTVSNVARMVLSRFYRPS